MDTSTNSYKYQPLPPDGSRIRLVTILAGEGDEPIKCTLSHYSFSDINLSGAENAEFEALSYVWGDATVTTPILLDGEPYRVTTNLAVALQVLRLPAAPRLLWIDAICINQASKAERAQEVRRIGAIYRGAARVTIWLGRGAEPGDRPLGLDDSLVSEQTHSLLNQLADSDADEDGDIYAAADILQRTGDMNLACQLLLRFFSRPWWLRVWILQEVALAETAVLVYGDRTISWDTLDGATNALHWLTLGRHAYIGHLCGIERANVARGFRIWACEYNPPPEVQYELADLLWRSRFSQSTEPRDRLFGILGLVKGDVSREKLLEVDYTKPVADVFRDLSVFMAKNGCLNHVLCSITDPVAGLPSWVSTWTWKIEDDPSEGGSGASKLSFGVAQFMQRHLTDGTERLPSNPPRFSSDLSQVTVKGRIFDRFGVRYIAKSFDPIKDEGTDTMVRTFRERLIQWEDKMESFLDGMERWEQSVDGKSRIHEWYNTSAARREAWKYALLHETLDEVSGTIVEDYDMITDRENELPLSRESEIIVRMKVEFEELLGNRFDRRKPFITMMGYMGSTGTNCDIQCQDQVCLLVGSDVPYLLRPIDHAKRWYRFLGACWVPRLVDRDIAEGVEKGVWELDDITLV